MYVKDDPAEGAGSSTPHTRHVAAQWWCLDRLGTALGFACREEELPGGLRRSDPITPCGAALRLRREVMI